jgi:hypothetical protein
MSASRYVAGVVIVSPKAAAALEALAEMTKARTSYRGDDQEIYDTFLAIREAALDWRAFVARKQNATDTKGQQSLEKTFTPKQAADQLRITPAGIRLAIREGRLKAKRTDTGWSIHPADLDHYAATRR